MKVKVRRVSIHLYLLVPRPLPAWPSARSILFQRFIDTLTSLKLCPFTFAHWIYLRMNLYPHLRDCDPLFDECIGPPASAFALESWSKEKTT